MFHDVWSRPARKYRIRAVIMLALLYSLFAGLCCFTFWIRTGELAPWRSDSLSDLLLQSFRPLGANQITLSDLLTRPIPVQEVPVHALTMGLLFASLCSMPVLVTILYRFPFAVPFAAMVFALAALPWLGVTVLLGCALAAIANTRLSFRYASALLGLIPMAIYFVAASWEPDGAATVMAENQALLYAPWVLAILSSCVICALGLAIARFINYRPGGMPPILALLFAIPLGLFFAYVGRDELEYRVLEADFGRSNASAFAPVDIGALARHAATARWTDTSSGSYDALYEKILHDTRANVLRRAEQRRIEAIARCDRFIENFPKSPYVPDVLVLKARCQDYRLNLVKLRAENVAEFRADMPSHGSRLSCRTLAEQFPNHPGAAHAQQNLAILNAVDGQIADAISRLEALIGRIEQSSSNAPRPSKAPGFMESALSRGPRASGAQSELSARAVQAHQLLEMLQSCEYDKAKPYSEIFFGGAKKDFGHPVQLLLSFDPTHTFYEQNLTSLAATFPDAETTGYVLVRLTSFQTDPTARIKRLEQIVTEWASRPAGAHAMFLLGDALFSTNDLDRAQGAFTGLVNQHPRSVWARAAGRRLDSMKILGAELGPSPEVRPAEPKPAQAEPTENAVSLNLQRDTWILVRTIPA